MPTEELRVLREQVVRFEHALDRVDALAASNDRLERALRRQRFILIGFGVVVALLILLGVGTLLNQRSIERNSADDAQRLATAALQSCQARNQTNVVVRQRFDNFYSALDALGTTPQFHQFVADLKAKDDAVAVIKDRDCDLNGSIDDGDYPPPDGSS